LKKGTSLFEIILSFLNEKPINKEYHKNISKKFCKVIGIFMRICYTLIVKIGIFVMIYFLSCFYKIF